MDYWPKKVFAEFGLYLSVFNIYFRHFKNVIHVGFFSEWFWTKKFKSLVWFCHFLPTSIDPWLIGKSPIVLFIFSKTYIFKHSFCFIQKPTYLRILFVLSKDFFKDQKVLTCFFFTSRLKSEGIVATEKSRFIES